MPEASVCRVLSSIFCLIFLSCAAASAAEKVTPKIAIIVSQRIRPYQESVEGLRQVLVRDAEVKTEEFDLETYQGRAREVLIEDLKKAEFDLFVAIGPIAARFIWSHFPSEDVLKVYTMVLGPETVLDSTHPVCGVELGIPPRTQLQIVSRGFPGVRRVGILYDPAFNSNLVREAAESAPDLDLKIVPLQVSSEKDIFPVLERNWEFLDALWLVPDRTVISESLVQQIIKEALLQRVAAVGYNRFFYECGAALAFVLDYQKIGSQTARVCLEALAGRGCHRETPVFSVWLNARVAEKLGIPFTEKYAPPLELGP